MPAAPTDFRSAILAARAVWREQVNSFLGEVTLEDLSGFIIYAKEFLDLLLWGAPLPLGSLVSPDQLGLVSKMLQRFGLRAEDLATIWRALPSTYRVISRLSWGVRYLSNNLSHPHPPKAEANAFLRVCALPLVKQSAISAIRSGHSLLTTIRPLRVLHRALDGWRGRAEIASAAHDCASAIVADMDGDKLLRREFAERLRRLNVISASCILDALAHEVPVPGFSVYADDVLTSAGLISTFSKFFDSQQGRAYAEIRLALHSELDFQRRFNMHSLSAPQRYTGIWQGTVEQLVTRLEDTRKTRIPI